MFSLLQLKSLENMFIPLSFYRRLPNRQLHFFLILQYRIPGNEQTYLLPLFKKCRAIK